MTVLDTIPKVRPDAYQLPSPERLSLAEIVAAVLLAWRRVVLFACAGALVSVLIALLQPPHYVVSAAIMTQSPGGSTSRLAGLASQLGLDLTSASGGPSPELFASFLRSENLQRRVVDAQYTVPVQGQTKPVTFGFLLGAKGGTRAENRAEAVAQLRKSIAIAVDDQSGLVTLTVTTKSPQFSLQLAKEMLEALDDLNTQLRQKQADAESRFIEERLAAQGAALRGAEDQVEAFMKRNRLFQSDPELSFQYQRLTRAQEVEQTVYTSLAQGYQQVRIDAARNTPTISVVEEPLLPDRPAPVHLWLVGIIGMILGGALALLTILTSQYATLLKRIHPNSYERVSGAWAFLVRDVRQRLHRRSKDALSG